MQKIAMNKTVYFLGAGFSADAGYRGTSEI